MESFHEVGSRVWLLEGKNWVPAVVTESKAAQITFRTEYDKTYTMPMDAINRQNVTSMHQTSIDGVDDMANLADLHDSAILHNIHVRFKTDKIYSYIGSILCSVNPYFYIHGLYDTSVMEKYRGKHIGELEPHIYAIANETYYSMWKKVESQCILISGESGSGKTECSKFILNFLSEISSSGVSEKTGMSVEKAIIQSSPILEAFGNAKTVYNNNSSRFGKFIYLDFNAKGRMDGGTIQDYLLEKNRVVRQNPGERNYHIFYSLLSGASETQRNELVLYPVEKYHYLRQSGCVSDPSINDKEDFQHVMNALKVMMFNDEEVSDLLQVISGILMLGNVNFLAAGGAQVADKNVLENVANLLHIDFYDLGDALTMKTMILRGEEIQSPLTVEQAAESRDAMAMNLYACTFKWVIGKINKRVKGNDHFSSIGLLDIFGFENFEINRFEQFNINYANEKLQQYFNKHIFSLEQHEYNREGLSWADIDWQDNGECLDLIERKLGVLALIDEESRFPKGTDESMLDKLHSSHQDNGFYLKPRVANTKFGIKHYAGEVFYDTKGFLEKNRDTLRDDILNCLRQSRSDFIYDIMELMKPAQPGGHSKSAKKRPTVSSNFRESLGSLMTTLGQSHPFFVRCIKPNHSKSPQVFDPKLVVNQLRYSGMLETVRIRRAGFPVRLLFDDFVFRYKVLMRGKTLSVQPSENCASLVREFDPTEKDWKIGKTKVFMKDQLEYTMERKRNAELVVVAMLIKRRIVGYMVRKQYLKTRRQVILVQKLAKARYYRNRFIKMRSAATIIAKYERRRVARLVLKKLLEEKRQEEERKLEEERRKEEERRREMERLEQERKIKELEELKRKAEEEARIKAEKEKERKRIEEEERLAALLKVKALEEARRAEEQAKRLAEAEKRRQEEEERKRLEEEARLRAEEEERHRQEEEARKMQAEAEAAEQIAELDRHLKYEDSDEEEEEDEDDVLGRPPSVYEMELETLKDGYLMLRGGLLSLWKKHWCVLKDDTFMWFRGKQDALKSGWLMKKGGGTGTLSRRNWKRRWFVLKDETLTYYETDQEGSKASGVIDIRKAMRIIDDGVKENGFSIVTESRTYHIVAESVHEWNQWYNILNRVNRATEAQLKDMREESANVKNAVGTIDVTMIESCTVGGVANKPNCFTIITANRVMNFMTETEEEQNGWLDAINDSKQREVDEGFANVLEKGWMVKEGADDSKRKRWFVLTGNSLDYYKSFVKNSPKFGSIILNSLCSVVPPEEKETGDWTFIVNGRKRSYVLHVKQQDEANRWASAIQEVVDSKPLIETPFEKLVMLIKDASNENEVEQIIRTNPILKYSKLALKAPLLALPYGHSQSSRAAERIIFIGPFQCAKGKGYGTFQEEAVRIFSSLQEQETVGDPIPVIQGILQTCQDLKSLRDEVFCQLIKQTTTPPDIDSIGNLRNMQVLVCMCCTFIPTRKYLRYLRTHLKRLRDKNHNSEMAKFATFALECAKRSRPREFPPSREEIISLLGRRELSAVVHCYGGGSCKITINSATTAGEVTERLSKGLNLTQIFNIFSLFEQCGSTEKSIEARTVLADVLSKFERYKALGMTESGKKWKLFFKVFCYLEPEKVPEETVESGFLYEQACDAVLQGKYPSPATTVYVLAALRLQFTDKDYRVGAWVSELETVYPMGRLKHQPKTRKISRDKSTNFSLKGTLRKAVTPFKTGAPPPEEAEEESKTAAEEELSAIKSSICEQWKKFQGLDQEHAQRQYMEIVKSWPGYGSTLFEVETKDPGLPSELWIGVSFNGVSIYKRGDMRAQCSYTFENILSFGAPQPNVYKIVVDGREPMLFITTQVIEIAKLMKAYINEIVRRRRESRISQTSSTS